MCTAKSVVKANNKDLMKCDLIVYNVPGAGIEPALPKELDFESSASTSSAIRAVNQKYYILDFFITLWKQPTYYIHSIGIEHQEQQQQHSYCLGVLQEFFWGWSSCNHLINGE